MIKVEVQGSLAERDNSKSIQLLDWIQISQKTCKRCSYHGALFWRESKNGNREIIWQNVWLLVHSKRRIKCHCWGESVVCALIVRMWKGNECDDYSAYIRASWLLPFKPISKAHPRHDIKHLCIVNFLSSKNWKIRTKVQHIHMRQWHE